MPISLKAGIKTGCIPTLNIAGRLNTNIPPGKYILQVKASNSDGYWSEQPKSLAITILPPPWKTWWAYLLYVVVLVCLLLLSVYILNERRKGLNELTLLSQLKQVDKIKDEFLANTSHELRTPLNGIIGLAESLIDGVTGPLSPQTNQQLALVVSSGRRLANLVNDILDFAKLESHQLKLKVQPVNLHSITEVVIALSQHRLATKSSI
jgi:signal transduction histidine kinase